MIHYSELEELRLFYLEDSWVLDVTARPGSLALTLDVVLLKGHPDYRSPLPGEQYCYKRGALRFEGVTTLNWEKQGTPPSKDASGEFDYGSIDTFDFEGDNYRVMGPFGEILFRAQMVRMVFAEATTAAPLDDL